MRVNPNTYVTMREMPVAWEDGGRGVRVGWRVAACADNVSAGRVARHRGAEQDIPGKCNREVLRVSKGEEGLVG